MHGQKPNLQPLENILANMKVTTVKKSRSSDKLGAEAAKIIKSLPDLSFMQAKVLMFPIRHQAEWPQGQGRSYAWGSNLTTSLPGDAF